MSHVSIYVFHCGPAEREVEIFVEALSYRGPPLVGDVLHTHGRKTAPLTPRRILAEDSSDGVPGGVHHAHMLSDLSG